MFDEITINLWSSWNFTCMKNIIRTCNLTVRFLKFTLNIEIYGEFVEFLSKLIWRETLFHLLGLLLGLSWNFFLFLLFHLRFNLFVYMFHHKKIPKKKKKNTKKRKNLFLYIILIYIYLYLKKKLYTKLIYFDHPIQKLNTLAWESQNFKFYKNNNNATFIIFSK